MYMYMLLQGLGLELIHLCCVDSSQRAPQTHIYADSSQVVLEHHRSFHSYLC